METRKQIENNLRNKIAKQYKTAIDYLTEKLKLRTEALVKKEQECKTLQEENNSLKEKMYQQEDWIQRMLDFCNMSEEDRNAILMEAKAKQKAERFKTSSSIADDFIRCIMESPIYDFYLK